MGGEQKPLSHAYLRGGGKKRQIVVVGSVVGFFGLLSMTGLGHSHNATPKHMPRHAALSRHVGDGHPSEHRDRNFASHAVFHDSDDDESLSHPKPKHAHNVLFGTSIEDALEKKASEWLHDVVDNTDGHRISRDGSHHHNHHSLADPLHDTAVGLERSAHAADGLSHLMRDDMNKLGMNTNARDSLMLASFDSTKHSGLGKLAKMSKASHSITDQLAMENGDDLGGLHQKMFTHGEPVWHPPPKEDLNSFGNQKHSSRDSFLEDDVEESKNLNSDLNFGDSRENTRTSVSGTAALSGDTDSTFGEIIDNDDDSSFASIESTRVAVTSNTNSVLLSCERCTNHGLCALGGDCKCVVIFHGTACRTTRPLVEDEVHTKSKKDKESSKEVKCFVLDGFAHGFGGFITLTKENAPAKLVARPDATDNAVRTNAVLEVDEEDDWIKYSTSQVSDFDSFEKSRAGSSDGFTGDSSFDRLRNDDTAFGFDDNKLVESESSRMGFQSDSFSDASGTSSTSKVKVSSLDSTESLDPELSNTEPPPAPPAKFGKITANTRLRLPERGPFDETVFNTCAIVGSGGFHMSTDETSQLGEEVDAHDAVFRFGDDPTVGYEQVVGSKTTFRFVVDDADTNPGLQYEGEVVARSEKGKKHEKSEHEKTATVRFVRDSVSFKRYLAARLAKPDLDAHIAHPGFLTWVDHALAFQPTAEMYGVLVAVHKCREVNLYGFQTQSFHGAKDLYHEASDLRFDGSDSEDLGMDVMHDSSDSSSDSSTDTGRKSVDQREWVVLRMMKRSGLVHFAEPCVLECHTNSMSCDNCHNDPESISTARAQIGRSKDIDDDEDTLDDTEDGLGASLEDWMSGVQGAFAHGGFEKNEERGGDFLKSNGDAATFGTSTTGTLDRDTRESLDLDASMQTRGFGDDD